MTPGPGEQICPSCGGSGMVDFERVATPDEVSAGCELGLAYDRRPRPRLECAVLVPDAPPMLTWIRIDDNGDGTSTLTDSVGNTVVFPAPIEQFQLVVNTPTPEDSLRVRNGTVHIPATPDGRP